MKELPKIYASPMNKEIKNNKDFFYSKLLERHKNINQEIDNIFHDRNFVYKSEVEITTNDNTIITTIVGKSGNYLLALDGAKYKISDIKDIKKL